MTLNSFCCRLERQQSIDTVSQQIITPFPPAGAGRPSLLLLAGVICVLPLKDLAAQPTNSTVEIVDEISLVSEALEVPAPTPSEMLPPVSPVMRVNVESMPVGMVPPARTRDVTFEPPMDPGNDPTVRIGRPVMRPEYNIEGNRRAQQLRTLPPQNYTFDRSSLRDVLRFLAEEAGIPYIGIPEHSPQAQRLVTFRMAASPFAALESLARQNDVQLTYEDGVWFMRLRDANLEQTRIAEENNELVGVVYQLKHDPVERVDFRAGGEGAPVGQGGMGQSSSRGTGGSGISTPNLPLQYSQKVFEARAPRIVNEIRIMLGMKPLEYNTDGTMTDPETIAGSEVARAPIPPFDGTRVGAAGEGPKDASLFPVYVPPQKPQVIYNSDTNILWVVATRKQHKWVGEYLARVDKPQDLIAIEVKFFETKKNPQVDFGIDWQGTFGDGVTVRGSGDATLTGSFSTGSLSFTNNSGGSAASVAGMGTGTIYSAVLSVDEVSATLRAFMQDRNSSLVQYPRVLTINNREVAITAAENTPVNAGVQTVQSGGTSSQPVGTLEYLPIGTQINILPKTIGQNQIALTVAITVSSIIGEIPIDLGTGRNLYPVTSGRVYNASLQVDSGYTLAVGGLEKVDDRSNIGGVPVLKDIPGLGYFFKSKTRSRDRHNLIIFITPYVISDPSRTPGISEQPETVIPLRPGLPPPAPNFTPEGQLLGGMSAVPNALAWMQFQLEYFRQINDENLTDRHSVNELRRVIERARAVSESLQAEIMAGGGLAPSNVLDDSARADALLVDLNRTLAAAQQNLM